MANVVQYILEIDSKGSVAGLKKAGAAVDRFDEKTKRSKKSALDLASKLGAAFAGLGAALGIASSAVSFFTDSLEAAARASFDLTRSVVDSVNQLNDLSTRSGLTAGSIQALIQAFEGSGQSAQQAESFISRFPKLLSDLQSGSARASEAADALGVSIVGVDGNLKSSDQVLQEVIGSLQQIDDRTQRAVIATDLFGRSAGGVLQALGETAPFEKFLEFTNEFGVRASPKASEEAARFQQLLSAIGIAAGGLRQTFIDALGGVGIFNAGLKQALIVIVSLQEFIRNSEDDFQLFGKTISTLASGITSFFLEIFTKLSQYIQEITAGISANLSTQILFFQKLGLISERTSKDLISGLVLATKSAEILEKQIAEIAKTGFLSDGSAGARVDQNIEEILEGISKSINGAIPDLNNFGDAIEDVATAAKEADFQFQPSQFSIVGEDEAQRLISDRQLDPTNIIETIEAANKLIEEFGDPIQKRLDGTRGKIQELETAIDLYNNLNLDTIELQSALNQARNQEIDLLRQQATATETFAEKLAGFASGLADGVGIVSTPQGAVKGIEETVAGVGAKSGSVALAAVAPIVAAVIGTIGAIEKLGESREEDLKQNFDDFITNFTKGIDLLPEIFAEILPKFIADLTVALLGAIGELAVTIPAAILSAVPVLIVELFTGLIDLFKQSFSNVTDAISALKDFKLFGRRDLAPDTTLKEDLLSLRERVLGFESGGRFIPSAESGMRFTGSSSGLAMLHKGEFVVPESNRTTQAVDRRMNQTGSGINVVINADIIEGSAVDELVRKIEQRFSAFGSSTSTLFGGA